jgi:hypothetical protein
MSGRMRDSYVTWLIGLAGVWHVGTGLWAFAAPRSFYSTLATFPPYHEHFLHDIGAFLLGIGAALLGALVWRDVKFVVLLGATVAATAHWAAHLLDRDHGGAASDPWVLGAIAVLLLVGLVLRRSARDGVPAEEVAVR